MDRAPTHRLDGERRGGHPERLGHGLPLRSPPGPGPPARPRDRDRQRVRPHHHRPDRVPGRAGRGPRHRDRVRGGQGRPAVPRRLPPPARAGQTAGRAQARPHGERQRRRTVPHRRTGRFLSDAACPHAPARRAGGRRPGRDRADHRRRAARQVPRRAALRRDHQLGWRGRHLRRPGRRARTRTTPVQRACAAPHRHVPAHLLLGSCAQSARPDGAVGRTQIRHDGHPVHRAHRTGPRRRHRGHAQRSGRVRPGARGSARRHRRVRGQADHLLPDGWRGGCCAAAPPARWRDPGVRVPGQGGRSAGAAHAVRPVAAQTGPHAGIGRRPRRRCPHDGVRDLVVAGGARHPDGATAAGHHGSGRLRRRRARWASRSWSR